MFRFLCPFIVGLLFSFSIATRIISKIFFALAAVVGRIASSEITRTIQRDGPEYHKSKASSDHLTVGRTNTAYAHGGLYDTWRRTSFAESLQGEGCRIFAWPSRGGVVIIDDADAVEMMFLGFDRFDPPIHRYPADEQDKEDAFVRKLLTVGGKLWQSQRRKSQVERGREEPEGEERIYRAFGRELADGSGGVLELAFDDYDKSDSAEERVEMARVRMAITMEERCMVLRRLGATFYKDSRQCEGLRAAYPPSL